MKRRSKTTDPSRPVKMGLLMKFLCFTFVGRAIALASSDIAAENPSHLENEIKNANKTKSTVDINRNSPTNDSIDVHNRKSRALPLSETLTSVETPEENYLEYQTNNLDDKSFISSDSDGLDKRAIPMIRFGRSGTSMIPTIRFGRSGSSMIPTLRFGRSGSSMIPAIRFGRSGSMIPTIRFGRSGSSMIPAIRFGRSDNSMIPMLRYGRMFKNSEDTSVEANLVDMETDEDGRFEEKNDLYENNVNYINHANVNDGEISNINPEDMSDEEFINKILKRQTNESIIPQIRYGRSALKSKDVKPPFFILPNIRPGRSPNEDLDTPEEASEPYFSDVQGFLGLFGAFRRSDDDITDDSRHLQEMELSKKVEDFLLDSNIDRTQKQLFYKSNKDPLYVIPYPRPGKRQLGKFPFTQKDIEENGRGSTTHLFKINKISDYVLPYPRPGKKRQGTEEILEYTRSKRSASILPYPRPGRSSSILPYPRPGRSSSILPYPRPGRSSSILPYPRPGRSSSMLPYPRPGRSSSILPYPRPGRSSTEGNYMLPYPRPGRSSTEGNYMLPYPRPGRSERSLFDDYEADNINNQFESQNKLKRTKRSTQNYELTYMLNPVSKESAGNTNSYLEHFDSDQGEGESKLASSHHVSNFLKKFKGREINSNPIYILPYPRPGRDV